MSDTEGSWFKLELPAYWATQVTVTDADDPVGARIFTGADCSSLVEVQTPVCVSSGSTSIGYSNNSASAVTVYVFAVHKDVVDDDLTVKFNSWSDPPVKKLALNETSGTSVANSGTEVPATATLSGASRVDGLSRNGLSFDGTNDKINSLTTEGFNPAEGSALFWVKDVQTPSGSQGVLFGAAANANSEIIRLRAEPGLVRVSCDARSLTDLEWSGNLNDGLWHLIGVTWSTSANSNKLYVDGILRQSLSYPTITYSIPTSFHVGCGLNSNGSVGNYWKGILDDARIFNRPLTATEMMDHFGPTVVPKPQEVDYASLITSAVSSSGTYQVLGESSDGTAIAQMETTLASRVSGGSSSSPNVKVVMVDSPDDPTTPAIPSAVKARYNQTMQGVLDWQKDQGYLLYASPPQGSYPLTYYIVSANAQGRFYGAQSLRQILGQYNASSLPSTFSVVDYPDYKVRNMFLWQHVGAIFLNNDSSNSYLQAAARNYIDYLSLMKYNQIDLKGPSLISSYLHVTSSNDIVWNTSTHNWVDRRTDTTYSGHDANFWVKRQAMVQYLRDRFMEPTFNYPSFKGGKPWMSLFDKAGVEAGIFLNRVPFDFPVGGGDAVLVEEAAVLLPEDNALANGDFEEATDQYIRPYSSVDGQNYYYMNGETSKQITFTNKTYQDLKLSFWASGSTQSGVTSQVSITESGVLGANTIAAPRRTGGYFDMLQPWVQTWGGWALYEFPVFTGSNSTHHLLFEGSGTKIDGIRLIVENCVRNARFTGLSGSDLPVWQETLSSGTISVTTSGTALGGPAMKLTRTTSGTSKIQQDIQALPNTEYTVSTWVSTTLSGSGKGICYVTHLSSGSPTTTVESVNPATATSGWYQQTIRFKTNSEGTFRLTLQHEGIGNSMFEAPSILGQETEFENLTDPISGSSVASVGFENKDLYPTNWEYATEFGDYYYDPPTDGLKRILTSSSSSAGEHSVTLREKEYDPEEEIFDDGFQVHLVQSPAVDPYAEYEAGVTYTAMDPMLGVPDLKITDFFDGTPRLDEALPPPTRITELWQPFRKTVSVGESSDVSFLLNMGSDLMTSPGISYDDAYLIRTNLLDNPSFEGLDSPSFLDWTSDSELTEPDFDSGDVHDGSTSLHFLGGGKADFYEVSQPISVKPYHRYAFEVWAKVNGVATAFCDVSTIHHDEFNEPPLFSGVGTQTSSTDWVRLTGSFTSGANTTVYLRLRHAGDDGESWFDGANLFQCDYLNDGGFEKPLNSTIPILPTTFNNSEDVAYNTMNEWSETLGYQTHRPIYSLDDTVFAEGAHSLKIDLAAQDTYISDPAHSRAIHLVQRFEVMPWQTLEISAKVKWSSLTNVDIISTNCTGFSPLHGASNTGQPLSGEPWPESVNYFTNFDAESSDHTLHPMRRFPNDLDSELPFTTSSDWVLFRNIMNTGRRTVMYVAIDIAPISEGTAMGGTIWIDDFKVKPTVSDHGSNYHMRFPSADTLTFESGSGADSMFVVTKEDGTPCVKGTDYAESTLVAGTGSIPQQSKYNISALSGGNIEPGDRVLVSWNESPALNRASQFEAQILGTTSKVDELYSLLLNTSYTNLAVKEFHMGMDDVFFYSLDSRDLSLGKKPSQRLEGQMMRIKNLLPTDVQLRSWGDAFNRYNFGGGSERCRAIELTGNRWEIVPWKYFTKTVSGQGYGAKKMAPDFTKLARRLDVRWSATPGNFDNTGLDTPYGWLSGARPGVGSRGCEYWFGQEQYSSMNTYTIDWDGMPVCSEVTWNHDGYVNREAATIDAETSDELPYRTRMMGTTTPLGDVSVTRW